MKVADYSKVVFLLRVRLQLAIFRAVCRGVLCRGSLSRGFRGARTGGGSMFGGDDSLPLVQGEDDDPLPAACILADAGIRRVRVLFLLTSSFFLSSLSYLSCYCVSGS